MKIKTILLIIVQAFFFTALSAQTTQEAADGIVLKRMSQESRFYVIAAKEDVQSEMTITTSAGEELELDYPCWVYYVSYADTNQGRYIIVNEANGNLLEVDAKSGAEPENLAEWKEVYCHNENYSIKHVKTELGGCNVKNDLTRSDSEIERDTVSITISEDFINVFVGLNYICCAPFETNCETIDDTIIMYIIDTCSNPYAECYCRCMCYYTFDFVFKYQGEINQKYKVLLRPINSRAYYNTKIFSEGIINSKNH